MRYLFTIKAAENTPHSPELDEAPTQEVIGGYAFLNASSKAEAIELGRTFMQLHADILGPSFEAECEIRQVSDAPGGRS